MKILLFVLILFTAGVVSAGNSTSAVAPLSFGFEWPWSHSGSSLQGQINQLNRMLGHVRWQFTRYHSNRALQQDYFRIKHEATRLNERYKSGSYDRKRMRGDIHGLRVRLQEIEVRLKVKKADLYQWR